MDYAGTGPFPLRFERHYNSNAETEFGPGIIGFKWTHNYSARAILYTIGTPTVEVSRADGNKFYFVQNGSEWRPKANITDTLTQLFDSGNPSGWRYVTGGGDIVEIYNLQGRLVSISNRAGLTQTLTYDSSSAPLQKLVTVADAFGRTLSFTYDSQGRIATLTDPAGGVHTYSYDASFNLISVAYPNNSTRTYHYENSNFPNGLTGITDENGNRYSTYTYALVNGAYRGITSELAGGVNKFTFSYSFDTGVTTVVDATNTSHTYNSQSVLGALRNSGLDAPSNSCGGSYNASTFDANTAFLTSSTDFNGNRTNYTYDARGLETSRTEGLTAAGENTPQTRTITTEWHSNFRLPTLITEKNDVGATLRTTATSYDSSGSLLTSTITDTASGRSRTLTYTYNANGQVLTMDSPRTDVNDITAYTYYANDHADLGKRGNLASTTNALGHVTQITAYNAHGQPLTIVDPNGLTTTLTYDGRMRLTSRTVGGETTSYTYDGVGQLTTATLPDGSFLNYTYDAAHRLTQMTDSLGNKIVYTLDALGNRTQEQVFDPSNALAQTKSRVYNSLNRLAQEIGAQNQATQYAYDNQGNLTQIADPLNNVTTNTYDALSRLARMTDPNSGQVNYGYNALDQMTSVADPRGLTTSYSYDALSNLNQLVSPDTGTTQTTYDAAGNVLTSTDARGILTSRSYDALNRPVQVNYAGGQSAVYAYDQDANALGRLTSVTDSSGSTAWSYDAQGRVIQKRQIVGSATLIIRYAYDAQGRLTQTTYPSGRNIGYAYDAAGRVAAITVDGQPLLGNIGYQPFGAPARWNWSNGSAYSRSFDLDGRITAFPLGADNARSLTYDAAGRITRASDLVASPPPNLPESATLNVSTTSNRLLSITGTSPRSYTYDAAGNVTGDGTNAFSYDARGRLTQVSAGGSNIQYQLNALGQRVAKIGGNAANGGQYFAYDEAGHLLGEYDASLAPVQETIWLGHTPVAVVKPNSGVFFVFADQLGSPRVVTTQSLRTVWRWESGPFGTGAPVEGMDDSGANFKYNLRLPGQYFDAETGLHYNYYRNYDPFIGRYIESDPIGLEGGVNTYGYVGANPLWAIDPYGLAEICKRITEDEWIAVGRGRKIVEYRYTGGNNPLSDAIIDAATTYKPGIFARKMVPVYRDLQLEQLYKVDFELCIDECTKQQTRKTRLGTSPTRKYQENWFNPTTSYQGDPVWVPSFMPSPSITTRWGVQ